MSKLGEAAKKTAEATLVKPLKVTKDAAIFMGGNSKKIILSLIFFAVVLVDEIWLDNTIFPKNALLKSNVFQALCVSLGAITIKDFQNIIRAWNEKKVVGKAVKETKK